ncbi:protein TPR3-like isoform X3 [Rhododendron vialii]|uniref:protein TPR3-like isoform X3 n=1 Tax=Rhododendron vialii TaxID=182163 RepID=UPI00265E7550|nr:protein TPR3-like isoform X3 [Rhododendron vialii]
MSLSKELILLLLQFCHEEDLNRTAHMLEHETGVFFDMEHFEELVLDGNWDEAENYLLGFTRLGDDEYSIKIYFEMRKQKFLEALDGHDRTRALDILLNDLKAFAISNDDLYKEMHQLLTLDDFRKHASFSLYGDTFSARKRMMNELRSIIEGDPLFQDKLKFPHMDQSRLRRLINQSLNWQHLHCTYSQPDPDIKTLFVDHQCPLADHPQSQSVENNLLPFQATAASVSPSSCKETSTATQSVVSDGPAVNLGAPTAPGSGFNYVTDAKDSSCTSDTMPSGTVDGLVSTTVFSDLINRDEDLPKAVQQVLSEASSTTSMDFHPVEQNILLAGTSAGDVGLWDVSSGEKLLSRSFCVWKIKNVSKTFLDALVEDPHVLVNRICWSTDGSLFGVAFSKHVVQIYSYHGGSNVQKHLEIDAHVGGVNDLAFSKQNDLPFLITCGNDKLIQFILSMSVNGEIKAWLYDNLGSRVTYDAPGHCRTRMAYSADGKRLFSSGTTKDGESFILEWEESEGYVKRSYKGLGKCSSDVVQFDSSNNRFLVAGDDHLIKVWDIDNTELLTTIDADGDLPASPLVRINKRGTLVAVTANHNKIKILANPFAHELLQTSENSSANRLMVLPETLQKLIIYPISTDVSDRATEESNSGTGTPGKIGDSANSKEMKPESLAQSNAILEVWKTQINEPSQSRSLRLHSEVETNEISRLIYTNAGNAILALASNGIHLLWKWSRNETSLSGKATTKVHPQLWQPKSGLLMTNDLTSVAFEESRPCFALSKNDSYVLSASTGMISLFNMMTFKKIRGFVPPPVAATCIAFYPHDNNIIAIGMDDSAILIYNARTDQVISKLNGHSKRVTGLAFSTTLNILVSSGADAQVVVWNTQEWDKKKSKMLQLYAGRSPSENFHTHVQFHQNQEHFLTVHVTHLAIYETTELNRVKQWVNGPFRAQICHATFSCDSQLIYASFVDGTVLIFEASNFHLRCEINPTAYIPSELSSKAYPVAIAAHPQEPNQFALALKDSGVVVIEPLESTGKWGEVPSVDNISSSRRPFSCL